MWGCVNDNRKPPHLTITRQSKTPALRTAGSQGWIDCTECRLLAAIADVCYRPAVSVPLLSDAILKTAGVSTFFRPRDLRPLGITFAQLQRLVKLSIVEKVGQGLTGWRL